MRTLLGTPRAAVGIVTAVAVAAILAGCGRKTDGDTWMVIVGPDTVTVSEIGAAWNALPASAQRRFLEGTNPLGSYLLSFARKMMVEDEIERLGYLGRTDIQTWTQAWERLELCRAMQESLQAEAAATITPDDLAFFREHLGTTVWYTIENEDGASHSGPVHLAEIPGPAGTALASLGQGETAVLESGEALTLVSRTAADSAVIAQALADTVQLADYARMSISRRRAMERYDEMVEGARESDPPIIDDAGLASLAAWARGEADLQPEDTVLSSGGRIWTAAGLSEEARFEATVRIVNPTDQTWLHDFALALVDRSYCADELGREFPAAAESVMARSRIHALQLCADSLYDDFVLDSVSVSEAQIDSAWAVSPPEIPETRTVECVLLPDDSLEAFRMSIIDGTSLQEASQYDPLPGYSFEGGRTSRPLEPEEVPFTLGDSLFAMDPADTLNWFGPLPYPPAGGSAFMRLATVIPAHSSTREEAGPILSRTLQTTFIEERLTEWLAGLEQAWGLSINERALNDLPADPSLWVDL